MGFFNHKWTYDISKDKNLQDFLRRNGITYAESVGHLIYPNGIYGENIARMLGKVYNEEVDGFIYKVEVIDHENSKLVGLIIDADLPGIRSLMTQKEPEDWR